MGRPLTCNAAAISVKLSLIVLHGRNSHIGSTLKLLRVDAGMSLRTLARQVGVSSAYLSRVENGHDPAPTPERLAAIADALKLPPQMLVELAHQTAPALADYLERVPAAHAFFLEVARRGLDAAQLARLRAFMDTELRSADEPAALATLSSLIGDRIALNFTCKHLDEVISAGAKRLTTSPIAARAVAKRIHEREAASPTVLGAGVAVPHAIVPNMRTAVVLVTLRRPLRLPSPDQIPVDVVVVLVSGSSGQEHLEALAQIARLANHDLAKQLRGATSVADAQSVLRRIEQM